MRPWHEHEVQTATAGYREGLSARQIGEQLGRPRESVIGKMHRLGIEHPRGRKPFERSSWGAYGCQVSAAVLPQVFDELDAIAQRSKRSRSSVIREALQIYIDAQRRHPLPNDRGTESCALRDDASPAR